MKSVAGSLAVVTGGGSGMGAALVLELAREGASVAFSDISDQGIADTLQKAASVKAAGALITGHRCDVAKEDDWLRFRDEVVAKHNAKSVNILICQAGIGGGGVYLGVRTFLPLLKAAKEAHIINTPLPLFSFSPPPPKDLAVRGFTEALLTDCRINAPHIKVAIVMPGHIGTSIGLNTPQILGMRVGRVGKAAAKYFEENAPLTAAQAADIILDEAVKKEKWRVIVGDDAKLLDKMVRETPEEAYEESFFKRVVENKIFTGAAPPPDAKL
ncbi:hypothetical protein DFJ74DRAFT_726111 [Hyaloraphidium curvatum]|nr:hypothetical protein DFJ74DRAFT_726111 [Hyaloraphidium curvatum]